MDAIVIAPGIEVPLRELEFEYSRSSGPGGQHVNRTESRVTVRFALASSTSIPAEDRQRMLAKLSSRLTQRGEILVSAEAHRDRARNLADAVERLGRILREAWRRPRKRRPTRPTRASVQRRLQSKRRRSDRKRSRRPPSDDS